MDFLILKTIAICIVGGALISSLFVDERSPILSDRLITAGLGAFIGLIIAVIILGGWHLAALVFAMMEGTK
jgi:prepilin signal peptidase PulO-like enzyme (type II secretory pathway)